MTQRKLKVYSSLQSLSSILHFQKHQTNTTYRISSSQSPKQVVLLLIQRLVHNGNLLQKALDAMESALVNSECQHPLPKTADPSIQIARNYAPVPEQPVRTNLPVTGTIPDFIVYVHNGANPLFEPIVGHHLFDGDGMVHSVQIKNGSASYACRFTETQKGLFKKRHLDALSFLKPLESCMATMELLVYARGLCGLVDHEQGSGVANAALVYFNQRLLAMSYFNSLLS